MHATSRRAPRLQALRSRAHDGACGRTHEGAAALGGTPGGAADAGAGAPAAAGAPPPRLADRAHPFRAGPPPPRPLPGRRGVGWLMGRILFVLAAPRRRVALRNLALCYPDACGRQRRQWARETFVAFCQSWLDRSWLWFAPREGGLRRGRLQGALEELEGSQPAIIFAPHFYGMDAGGSALALHTPRAFTSIFSTQPDPAIDAWFRAGRQRFGDVRMLNRSDGVKPIVSSLRQGGLLYLLPDMDFGRNDSLFVPFYGVRAATVPSLSRFARLGRAKVLALVTRLTPTGYCAEIPPAWPGYPTGDAEADTTLMNAKLQSYIDIAPGQY